MQLSGFLGQSANYYGAGTRPMPRASQPSRMFGLMTPYGREVAQYNQRRSGAAMDLARTMGVAGSTAGTAFGQFVPLSLTDPTARQQADAINRLATQIAGGEPNRMAFYRQRYSGLLGRSFADLLGRRGSQANNPYRRPHADTEVAPPVGEGGTGGLGGMIGGLVTDTSDLARLPAGPGLSNTGYNAFTGQYGLNRNYNQSLGRFISGNSAINPIELMQRYPRLARFMPADVRSDIIMGPSRPAFGQVHQPAVSELM